MIISAIKKTVREDCKVNFNRSITSLENDEYTISLQCNIVEPEDDSIELHIRIAGRFRCNCEDSNQKEMLKKQNTVAILFPYLRSHVTLVTTQPDIAPIVLPPMNIAKMFKDSEK